MNKKGQLHIFLLLFVALALSAVALFLFISFNRNFTEPGVQRLGLISELHFNQDYIINTIELSAKDTIHGPDQSNISSKFRENVLSHNSGLDGMSLFFGKMNQSEFNFEKNDAGYEFRMEGMSVYAKVGGNNARRNFNIDISLDNEGNVTSELITPVTNPSSA